METVLQPKNKLKKKNCVSFLAQTHTFKPFFSTIESTKCFIFHSNLHGPGMKIRKTKHLFVAFTPPCSLLHYVFFFKIICRWHCNLRERNKPFEESSIFYLHVVKKGTIASLRPRPAFISLYFPWALV